MKKIIVLLIVSCWLCQGLNAQVFSFDFQNGTQGWVGDIADYPEPPTHSITQTIPPQYEFMYFHSPIPIVGSDSGVYISSNNRSDDIFMYIKRQVTGLLPNTVYIVNFEILYASNASTGAGIGGSPNLGLKIGAVGYMPDKFLDTTDGWWRMNIDKGNANTDGIDMKVVDYIGIGPDPIEYEYKYTNNWIWPKIGVRTNNNGEAWLIIGTDSGFEGITSLYYSDITAEFVRPPDVTTRKSVMKGASLSIGPELELTVESDNETPVQLKVWDLAGRLIFERKLTPDNQTYSLKGIEQKGLVIVGVQLSDGSIITEKVIIE